MLESMRRRLSITTRDEERGFTLVELMTVVAMTGVLAAICGTVVVRHVRAASTQEALAGLQAIRTAEEAFRAENGQYLNCSRAPGGVWYPSQNPGKVAFSWARNDHPDSPFWQQLALPVTGGTRFGYLANAGLPGDPLPTIVLRTYTVPAVTMTDPWYIIQLKGDRDGDGVAALGLAHSFSADVYLENQDE
jgi:prepilin-type N-terminal cleavage/methylation domain-containing protein